MDDSIHFVDAAGEAASEPIDLMNDPKFAPPERRDTASSKAGTDGGMAGETCRICRSEGTPDEPLFYPCKCSGSIKFVHQECLMEWLSHSHKKHCELCKTPFRFTKLYDANMPQTLPWTVFAQRACLHAAQSVLRVARAIVVSLVWLVFLPLVVRWAWRWMFWLLDVGLERERYMRNMRASQLAAEAESQTFVQNATSALTSSLYSTFENLWAGSFGSVEPTDGTSPANTMTGLVKNATMPADIANITASWAGHADASMLSSWFYLSGLTPSPSVNRIILDVFEGQLITCVVIIGFILVFLIREWVVQQQPLANLDLDAVFGADQRPQLEQIQRAHERLERDVVLLEEADRRIAELEREYAEETRQLDVARESVPEFQGWDAVRGMIDIANGELNGQPNEEHRFSAKAADVMGQILAAEHAGADASGLAENIFQKLKELPDDLRVAWETKIIDELKSKTQNQDITNYDEALIAEDPAQGSSSHRPPMPTRDTSSRATQIQRVLEEADVALTSNAHHSIAPSAARTPAEESVAENGSLVSVPSSTRGSRQVVSPPNSVRSCDESPDSHSEIPITNAGPDAKINIKRKGKTKAKLIVPEPVEIVEKPEITAEELRKRIDDKLAQIAAHSNESPAHESHANSSSIGADSTVSGPVTDGSDNAGESNAHQPAVSTGTAETLPGYQLDPTAPNGDNVPASVDAAFRRGSLPGETQDPANANAAESADIALAPQADVQHVSLFDRFLDWCWGDIQPQDQQDPVPAAAEVQLDPVDDAHEAPFAPLAEAQVDVVPGAPEDHDDLHEHDPEVVAAAQQAGLDAEAAEDAEDLEGIFELIGLEGPLIGLAQTSCFCSVLVVTTVGVAIGIPYLLGKFVLLILDDPVSVLFKVPLQITTAVTDCMVDLALMILGFVSTGFIASAAIVSGLLPPSTLSTAIQNISNRYAVFLSAVAWNAFNRLKWMFTDESGSKTVAHGGHWLLLKLSVVSHASLKTIQSETRTVLTYIGETITAITETISSGSASVVWESSKNGLAHLKEAPIKLMDISTSIRSHLDPVISSIGSLRKGSLTFATVNSTSPLDPTLVYWDSYDRGSAIILGYCALAMVATVYVTANVSVTNNQAGQKIEKLIRDSLRQAGGVLKVILIISIEMLVFPLYCGLLLDLAFLPLFQSASVASRWTFAMASPYTFCFVHWFVGTCYMFHFALFVGMCRKILRKGVLWFIRDPDDPTFHPVRDVLERNVTTQLRKIAFSALVYGALVILCLGGVIWGIGRVFTGIFPLHWISTEPVLEWPLTLLLFGSVTPTLVHLVRPSKAVHAMYAWWLRRCARGLRLSHFLFDDRRKDEEGHQPRKSWSSYLADSDTSDRAITVANDDHVPSADFQRDGKYVLTPCNDQYRPPKPGEQFIHVEDDDVYIADKNGKKNEHFAKVYVPPHFRLRITLFMVCLWIFSAFTGLCITLLPLCFGRHVLSLILPKGVMINDIYAYSIGAYFFGGLLYALLKGGPAMKQLRDKAVSVQLKAWALTIKSCVVRAFSCIYVYGFIGVVMPVIFTMLIQFYFIMPLQTYLIATVRPALADVGTGPLNSTVTNVVNATINSFATTGRGMQHISHRNPLVNDHNVHLLADCALSWQVMRLVLRGILGAPRAAEAFRRVKADGYTKPNARLATRYFVLPATTISLVLLAAPLGLAKSILSLTRWARWDLTESMETIIYRYSYPVLAGWVSIFWGTRQIIRATGRWRARIKDEVYLVGERLHNFGEKRPPVGSRSVAVRAR